MELRLECYYFDKESRRHLRRPFNYGGEGMKRLFFGGIHPADKKELTAGKGVIPMKSPEYVVIPMRQHIGAPCRPLVNVGDEIFMGQKIGEGEGLCVPVHASVSGKVEAIEERPHPGGGTALAIVIRNDGKYTWHENVKPHPNKDNLTQEELFWAIKEAGIVGMGGATFSTEVKAISSKGKIDTLLINACECEPYITADDALMITEPEKVLGGIKLLADALEPEKVVIAMEDNKKDAAASIQKHLSEDGKIELRILPTRYPQGAEKQLIKAVTGREVMPGKLPADVGCGVFNVSTVAAVYQAVYEGKPLIRRIVTVTGEGVNTPGNFLVPIGTSFSALIDAAGGLKDDADRVIAGGPMMGKAVETLDVPVIKGTGSVLCLLKEDAVKGTDCIRCGKCVEVCPMNLQPLYLYRYEKANDLSMLQKLNLMDCMECGCCSYTCPAKLPLVERFRAGKGALREEKK